MWKCSLTCFADEFRPIIGVPGSRIAELRYNSRIANHGRGSREDDMEKMHAYREKLEAQLQEWRVKIELLEEKAARATGETREEMLQAINELRQKKAALKGKWDTLQQESGVAFDRMKEGVEKAAGELKSTLDKVISRFK
jgi:hypothetical protein